MTIRTALAVLAVGGALVALPHGARACQDPPAGLEPRERAMAWTRTAICHARAMGKGETVTAVRAADRRNAVRGKRAQGVVKLAAKDFADAARAPDRAPIPADAVEAILSGPHGLDPRLRRVEARGKVWQDRQARVAARKVGDEVRTRPSRYRLDRIPGRELLCAFSPESHACPNGGRAERWLVARQAERRFIPRERGDAWNRCPSGWPLPDCTGGTMAAEGVPKWLRGLVSSARQQTSRALRNADQAAREAGNNDIYWCRREAVRACLTGDLSPTGCPSPCGAL